VYGKLYQDNQRFLWGILDSAREARPQGRNATQQKIGDYFAACMDEAAVEKLGAKPLAPYLARIDAMKDKRELGAVLATCTWTRATAGSSSAWAPTRTSPTRPT
jgi:endothelin-converting enzyme/putative endopeptidase